MSNADNSRIANNAVDTLGTIAKICGLGLSYDDTSIAAAALKDILRAIDKFRATEMLS